MAKGNTANPMEYVPFLSPFADQLGLQELVISSLIISPQPTKGAAAQNMECSQVKRMSHNAHFCVKVSFALYWKGFETAFKRSKLIRNKVMTETLRDSEITVE